MERRGKPAERLEREASAWLAAMYWTHFVTLTVDWDRPTPAALRRAFVRWLRKLAGLSVADRYFLTIEAAFAGRGHAHALICFAGTIPIAELRRRWTHGVTDIRLYDPTRGAPYYLAKALTDPRAEWEIGP